MNRLIFWNSRNCSSVRWSRASISLIFGTISLYAPLPWGFTELRQLY